MHPFRLACRLSALSGALVLAACASPSRTAADTATVSTIPPATMVQAIRASAGDGDGELAVQPLRDPMVEDLRARAVTLEAQGDLAGAVAALDEAMAIVDSDPALLQERAELAILQNDLPRATQLAERAYALGAQVGPLCRRHWVTLEQVRLSTGDAEGATQARGQADGCRVAGPNRY
ncbi:MAG: tetratricopeptide repeat protein [Luteimonas sp.]